MRYALIQNGTITEVVEQDTQPGGWTPCGNAGPGWVATSDGAFSAPVAPPPHAIPEVTMEQARAALILAGIDLNGISAMFDAMPHPQGALAANTWEFAPTVHIDNPLVQAVAQAHGWSAEYLQNLFNNA